MGPIRTIEDIIDMLLRRARLIVGLVILGVVASVVYALKQPHLYYATEVIQIERPRITDDLAPSTIEGSSARRLQLIQQQLMARDTILDIIGKLGLYDHLAALTDTEKVILFRESVTVEGIAAAQEGGVSDGTISALTISALMSSPEHARDAAHELGARTISLSAAARREKASATLEFFQSQEDALKIAIAALDQELSDYRSEHVLSQTGVMALNQTEFASLNEAILAVERNRIVLQRELATVDATSNRPATQRRAIQLQAEVTSLNEQQAFLEARIAALRSSLTTSPEIERQVGIYEARLEQYQAQLAEVSAHRAEAQIGDQLEANRQAERLEILEPAVLPDYPAEPSRKKLALMGAVASVMAALGLAYLLELKNPVIRSAAQLEREVGILPAAMIPVLDLSPRGSRGVWATLKALVAAPGAALSKALSRIGSAKV